MLNKRTKRGNTRTPVVVKKRTGNHSYFSVWSSK